MSSEEEKFLTADEEALLLKLARASLRHYLGGGDTGDLDEFELTETLRQKLGAFVTLRKGAKLRGCIGAVTESKQLADAVCLSAVRSATRDPRFPSVTGDELSDLSIEISALRPGDKLGSPFRKIDRIENIVIGRDGLYIMDGKKGGLLLPQVASERGWSVEEFLDALCKKARLEDRAWEREGVELYRFSAQVFSESK
ncbi:MAG: AmmeMemoRadiSam system protein A [Candidatus Hydrogenedentes bacterium]|jgi:AmmeMemoRadiSam system protein A|nr:AmmeMemoRadiSam system protein A [Candidatus Hydrogenedentota bacterium]